MTFVEVRDQPLPKAPEHTLSDMAGDLWRRVDPPAAKPAIWSEQPMDMDASKHLPNITIDSAAQGKAGAHWYSGALAVTEDLAKGAYKEATEHPLHLLESAAIGAATGVAIGAAAVAIGPEIAIGAAVVGTALAAGALSSKIGDWAHEAGVINHQGKHSVSEIAEAHKGLQGLGGGMADFAAGTLGGAAGAYAGGALASALTRGAVSGVAAEATPTAAAAPESALPEVAPIKAEVNPFSAPAAEPFTTANTTMTISNEGGWTKLVGNNGDKAFGHDILSFANNWATAMEQRMAAGEPMSREMISVTENQADTFGLSGSMYSMAKGALYDNWKFGPQLEAILNPKP